MHSEKWLGKDELRMLLKPPEGLRGHLPVGSGVRRVSGFSQWTGRIGVVQAEGIVRESMGSLGRQVLV